jgi:hypothetical protein
MSRVTINLFGIMLAVGLLAAALPAVAGEKPGLELRQGETVKTLLADRAGKTVILLLDSGQELSGKVAAVSDAMVHLTQLTGREFFDAAVRLDTVAGVIVRVRTR